MLSFVACLMLSVFSGQETVVAKGPNVVLIMADDLGYGELGCYGQEKILTPHLDALASRGMRFAQAYSGHGVCAPSRGVLMTGLHTGHCPIRNNSPWASAKNPSGEGQEPLPADTPNMARWFQASGYATGCMGKWGLGGPGTAGAPNLQGFDLFYGYLCQKQAHDYYPEHLWRNDEPVVLRNPGFTPSARWKEAPAEAAAYAAFEGEDYAPDLMLEAALTFVDEHTEAPFFLYYPTTVPHVALQVPEDSRSGYSDKGWDEAPYLGAKGYLPNATPRATYAAMITRMDRDVGRLLERLAEHGLENDTIVIFTSDNGPASNGGSDPRFFDSARGPIGALAKEGGTLRGLKGSMHEGGIRIPLIVTWPGHIMGGEVSERPVGFQDIWPTLAELRGMELPEAIDGVSFAPTLVEEGEAAAPGQLYWESGRNQALRVGDLKLVRKVNSGGKLKAELFDLSTDPWELENLAAERPEDLARMVKLIRAARTPSKIFPTPYDAGL